MAVTNDTTQLTGLLKNVYAKGIVDAYSFAAPLASRLIKFDQQAAGLGNTYNQPVDLQLENSFTSSAADTVPTFLAINAGKMENATATGCQLYGRSAVSYEAMARSKYPTQKAFETAVKRVTKRLSMSHLKRLEMQLICGRRGIAVVESSTNSTVTSTTIITAESWSAARFAGMVGATLSAQRANRSTAIFPTTVAGTASLTAVATSTRTLTIVGLAADMDDLSTANGVGAILYLESNGTITQFGNTTEIAGLEAWCNMSGTWSNIATGTYDLWNPNVYSTSTGVISFGKIVEAAEMTAPYGAVKKLVALCSVKAFSVLNTDLAALRQYDSSYKTSKGELGVEGIEFKCSVGTIEILPHPMCSDGICIIFAPDEVLRTGACDIEFVERNGEKLVLESATTPSGEMRTMSNQQLFVEQPRHLVYMSGITFG